MIDGTAKRAIDKFISTDPKFEDICKELQVYNRYVEQTQEITSLEYFTFIRLDCEKVRRGLGDAARDLANSLLQNVVDTYRKENESICAAFEEIERGMKGEINVAISNIFKVVNENFRRLEMMWSR